MKKFLMGLLAVVAMATGAARAQDFAGTWQGTLDVGKGLRIVLKNSKDDAKWKTVFYSIDEGGRPLAANSVVVDGPSIKAEFLAMGGAYEGKLSGDGNTIAGSFTQGGKSLPLNLTRATKETAWAIPEPQAKLPPMAKDAKPGFEVATIKLSKPEQMGKGFGINGHQVRTINTSLLDLIEFSFNVQAKQVIGLPAGLDTQKYDIQGRPDVDGQPTYDQLKIMIQSLLADRFKMKFHHEKKELSVFALTVGKTGSKLKESDPANAGNHTLNFHPGVKGGLVYTIRSASIEEMSQGLQQTMLDRPIADQTGLKGKYDFDLTFMPDDSMMGGMGGKLPPPPEGAEAPPSLFTAFQDQMGLKLEPSKAPVDVLVVDHVEKPSED